MEELNYEVLRRIQAKERGPALAQIPENFYELASALLTRCRAEQNFREYENVLKILKYIHSRRQEKIVTAAINSPRGVESPSEMTAREHVLYGSVLEILKADEDEFKRAISLGSENVVRAQAANIAVETAGAGSEQVAAVAVVAAGASVAAAHAVQGIERPEMRLLITKDIAEFVGLNGRTYGPFKSGDIIDIPPEEADILIKMKAAEWRTK